MQKFADTMLDYEWGNPSPVMLSGEQLPEANRSVFQQGFYETANGFNQDAAHFTAAHHYHHPNLNGNPAAAAAAHFASYLDSAAYAGSSSSYPPPVPGLSLEPACQTGFVVIPKSEPVVGGLEFSTRLGLNLGGRTYFASTERELLNRMYVRSRVVEPNAPRCQVERCSADLTNAKHYHRRHKVCEYHSKAATVVAAGHTQRFCQQCSRSDSTCYRNSTTGSGAAGEDSQITTAGAGNHINPIRRISNRRSHEFIFRNPNKATAAVRRLSAKEDLPRPLLQHLLDELPPLLIVNN